MTTTRPIALILLAALAGLAPAGEAAADGKRHRGEGRCHAHLLKKWDADKDGTLSDAEKQAARDHHRARRLARWDADQDGTLSDAEKQARRAHLKERCAKKKARADG
ncbi:MAG TPA: hypothetical protein VEL07_12515 [Planctomycetota bacterium]|nr:hypothetical protein [Planctomycetota bacterium]